VNFGLRDSSADLFWVRTMRISVLSARSHLLPVDLRTFVARDVILLQRRVCLWPGVLTIASDVKFYGFLFPVMLGTLYRWNWDMRSGIEANPIGA
jgi:hypothetical protein